MRHIETHTAIIGGGTAGSTLSGLLAENGSVPVLLLEAGPDYGPSGDSRWPADVVDARFIPTSHDWASGGPDSVPFARARVIGGSSAHNGCTVAVGAREDYDEWARAGNQGWSAEEIEPLVDLVRRRFRVRVFDVDELTPIQAAFVEAGQECGLPFAPDLDRLEAGVGIGPMAANIVDGKRWNASFAFLDPARDSDNLSIAARTVVHRLLVDGTQIVGAEVEDKGGLATVKAERFVLCGGAIGSPTLLQRSGLGGAAVGRNLLDHPCVRFDFVGTEMFRESRGSADWHPNEQALARAKSTLCDNGPYDIHIFLVAGENKNHPDLTDISIYGSSMKARSQGHVRAEGDTVDIGTGYLTDAEGHDAEVLRQAAEIMREISRRDDFASFLGSDATSVDFLAREAIVTYCHPAGTCKMGPADDSTSVVGSDGRVHGLDNLFVADASIMPTITRGNTNLPTSIIGAKIAADLLGKAPKDLWP